MIETLLPKTPNPTVGDLVNILSQLKPDTPLVFHVGDSFESEIDADFDNTATIIMDFETYGEGPTATEQPVINLFIG